MAKKKFLVVHPVRHNTRYHAVGTAISLETDIPKGETESEAGRLLRLRSIREPDVLVEAGTDPVYLGVSTLAKLNLAELNAYGVAHGYALPEGANRETLLLLFAAPPVVPLDRQREVRSEVAQEAQEAIDMANAEERAREDGR